jgi:hypothetical protein
VLTDFPFTDLTAAKRRPALVVSTDNDRRADVVVAYITSIPRDDPDAVAIGPGAGTGLKAPSLVRFGKIANRQGHYRRAHWRRGSDLADQCSQDFLWRVRVWRPLVYRHYSNGARAGHFSVVEPGRVRRRPLG